MSSNVDTDVVVAAMRSFTRAVAFERSRGARIRVDLHVGRSLISGRRQRGGCAELPISLRAAVERMVAADGTSMNQFLVMAVAAKLSAMLTAEAYFSAYRGQGDQEAARAFLSREGGESPRSGDEILKDD